ncbi:DUF6415 family natural product biosynthesis protein [Streptomyces sp. NPDC008139]|uniref:DUF6415 family natural product biosynthesis protein n=1 Tax=Streptomyces sp. NPDC008139 TaxID=3364814 RepID=UPI0036E734E9
MDEPPLLGTVLDDLEAALGEFSGPSEEEISGLEVRLSRAFDRFLIMAQQIYPPMSPEPAARVHRLAEEADSSGAAHGLGYVRRLALTVQDLLDHCCVGYPPSRSP